MEPLDRLIHALESAVDNAVKKGDTDYVADNVRRTILMRTRRGEFLNGSGGLEKRSYKSESHKKKRAKLGLPIDRVTLFMGRVGVLEAMRARSSFRAGQVTIEAGFLAGLSEARATEIAGYLDREGAGINHVTYPFVGLTEAEEEKIVQALAARIGTNFNTTFQ